MRPARKEPRARHRGRSRCGVHEAGRDEDARARIAERRLEWRCHVEEQRSGMGEVEPGRRPDQCIACPDVARGLLDPRPVTEEAESGDAETEDERQVRNDGQGREQPERDRFEPARAPSPLASLLVRLAPSHRTPEPWQHTRVKTATC